MTTDKPPLNTLRVLDVSGTVAGAYCTKLLTDCGAEVVHLEPPEGSLLRALAPPSATIAPGADGALFTYLARGKRSVVIDPVSPGASELVAGLVAGADVVVGDNGLPELEALARAAAGPADDGKILARVSAYGGGPGEREQTWSDLTLQALASSIASRGEKAGKPMKAGGELAAWTSGLCAAVAILIALRRRNLKGTGEQIDVSQLEAAVTIFNGFRAVSAQVTDPQPPPMRVVEVPSVEPAADGWVGFCALSADQFRGFAEMISHPEWATDPEIRRIDLRCERATDLRPVIREWTSAHSVAEILDEAARRRVPAAPVGNGATAPQIDHFAQRGVFLGRLGNQPRPPYQFSRTPVVPPGDAPTVGGTSPAAVISAWAQRGRLAPSVARTQAAAPLAGLRVFDMTSYWAGPLVGQLLGAFGADVIKVESVQRPDGTRLTTSYGVNGDRLWERTPLFQAVNTNKRGVTLELTSAAGRSLARRLLAKCDILIENYVPRVAERFGLLDDLPEHMIVVRMPAWGLTGPWRDRQGFAQTTEQVSGMAWLTGDPAGPPLIPRGPCDPIGGLHAAYATLAAILERDCSGRGQVIEVPLVESALNVAAAQFVEYTAYGILATRTGNRSVRHAPQGVYACAGFEQWVAIAVQSDDQWDRLRNALGAPEWMNDPCMETPAGRLAAHDVLDAGIGAWCAGRSIEAVVDLLQDADVPAAAVVEPHAVLDRPELLARNFWETVDHPINGRLRLPSFPARFETDGSPFHHTAAPLLGQHNADVLRGLLGVSATELESLAMEHVIGTEPLNA